MGQQGNNNFFICIRYAFKLSHSTYKRYISLILLGLGAFDLLVFCS